MKAILIILMTLGFYMNGICQEKEKSKAEKLLEELAVNSCKCIDSIEVYNKSKDDIAKEISKCIDNQNSAYQLGVQLANITDSLNNNDIKNGEKKVNIYMNTDKDSQEHKEYYYEMESYLMKNCKSIINKIAASEKQSSKSVSKNPKAFEMYSKGLDEIEKENYKTALEFFEKALKIDPIFAFAWDNIGICYRKLGEYDKAIGAYNKSLEVDPTGLLPLQNIAIVYQYKKEYKKAIKAYEKLAEIDKYNPEVYYGIGQIYSVYLKEYEKGLDNMCKAYNLYVEQKSPYRSDAEEIISMIHTEMKKEGKEEKFNEILKLNKISSK